jgi:HAD superfamily hydrolase (TIGR01509 family)
MDGVLIDSMGYHIQAWKYAFQSENVAIDENELSTMMYLTEGMSGKVQANDLLRKYADQEPDLQFAHKIESIKSSRYVSLAGEIKAFNGVFNLLAALECMGVPLAVVTGSNSAEASSTLQRLFPPKTFSVVITGGDVERGKPDPMSYLMALDRLGMDDARGCLVIENAPFGVRSAVGAGLRVFGILANSPLKESHLTSEGASLVVRHHDDLLAPLESLHSAASCGV